MEKLTAKQRVEKEAEELEERYNKLHKFIYTKVFDELAYAEKDYLCRQRDAMFEYLHCLKCRLSIWREI